MAKYEDYLPKPDGIEAEIEDAQSQQVERKSATSVDWEQRYKELEKLNSRQAQTLGEYRKTIDSFIVPTSDEASSQPESTPISDEDWYDKPADTVQRAVEAHPAIQEAKKLKKELEKERLEKQLHEFQSRHSDFNDIATSPEFQNWVVEDHLRQDLYQRGNNYDFSAADALFSLYKAEKGLSQAKSQHDISQAELVSSSGEMVKEPPRYSRSEYIAKLTAAKQGNLNAETWVKNNAAGYRRALESKNVRD